MKEYVFILAPDSFKGSMTAREVCMAMETGIRKVYPSAECIYIPMADGGEGTVQSLVDATSGSVYQQTVTGPLGQPVTASYGILGDGVTAVIEMASASGIGYIDKTTKNPLITTTCGTGELIKACIDRGVKKIITGIGGSATNDGGAGFAQAVGVRLLNSKGKELPAGGAALAKLKTIDISGIDPRLKEIEIEVACDVTNPLCGKNGASAVFGPQKGATPDMVAELDAALYHYASVIKEQLGKDIKDIPGAGAAGGLGAGLLAFTNARLRQGIEIVLDYTNFRQLVKAGDIVFTGEGGIDFQTKFGKTPYGVARAAKQEGKTVIAIAGYVGEGIEQLYEAGFDAIFSITPKAMTINEALEQGKENVAQTIENIVRLINTFKPA